MMSTIPSDWLSLEDTLKEAINCDDTDRIDYLASRGYDIPASAMQLAVFNDHLKVVKHLHEIYHHPYTLDTIRWALSTASMEIIEHLHEQGLAWPEDSLDLAACSGDTDMVLLLASQGLKPSTRSTNWVCECGNVEMLEVLYSIGAKCTDKALTLAIKNGHFEIVKILCEKVGVDYTFTEIDLAREHEQTTIANYLLKELLK